MNDIHTFTIPASRENISKVAALIDTRFVKFDGPRIFYSEPIFYYTFPSRVSCRGDDNCSALIRLSSICDEIHDDELFKKLSTLTFNVPNIVKFKPHLWDDVIYGLWRALNGIYNYDSQERKRDIRVGIYSNSSAVVEHFTLQFSLFNMGCSAIIRNISDFDFHEFMRNDANLFIVFDYDFGLQMLNMFEEAAGSAKPVIIASTSSMCIHRVFLERWGNKAIANYDNAIGFFFDEIKSSQRMTRLGLSVAKSKLLITPSYNHKFPNVLFSLDVAESVKFARSFLLKTNPDYNPVVITAETANRAGVYIGRQNKVNIAKSVYSTYEYVDKIERKIGKNPFIVVLKPKDGDPHLNAGTIFFTNKAFVIVDCNNVSREALKNIFGHIYDYD